ncbi:MAG TPA: DedA family protein [bacterium]|nr:DedA family protein [bacterium]
MTLEALIGSYGYPAIAVGTFFEGETILIVGGVAARLGYLRLPRVILCAFVGTLIGDQLFFHLGRHRGDAFLRKRPAWQERLTVVRAKLNRHQTPVVLGFRFVYGMRTITPFAIGLTDIGAFRFLLLNVISAAVWASVIGLGGYFIGATLETILGDIKRYELIVIGGLLLIGIIVWLWRRRKKRNTSSAPPA